MSTEKNTKSNSFDTPSNILKRIAAGSAKLGKRHPKFKAGDKVRVQVKIVEGTRERIQAYEGVVIKRSHGTGADSTFTVRKIAANNVGVERTFLVNSPRLDKVELIAKGEVRRARLFYLRPLRGKATRIKSRLATAAEAMGGVVEEDVVVPTVEAVAEQPSA